MLSQKRKSEQININEKVLNDINALNEYFTFKCDEKILKTESVFFNILLNPDKLSSDDNIRNYIIENRNLHKPIYEQHFIITILETNGIQILKNILTEINTKYKIKIISSPLYCVEFNDLSQSDNVKEIIENKIKDIECLFEMKELITVKELHVDI